MAVIREPRRAIKGEKGTRGKKEKSKDDELSSMDLHWKIEQERNEIESWGVRFLII